MRKEASPEKVVQEIRRKTCRPRRAGYLTGDRLIGSSRRDSHGPTSTVGRQLRRRSVSDLRRSRAFRPERA